MPRPHTKLTDQEKRDIQQLVLAIETNNLDGYLANFTNVQIDALCEAAKVATTGNRKTKVKRLIRKIKSNQTNIMTIAEIGVYRYLSAMMSLGTLWMGSAGAGGYQSIRALKHARENSQKINMASHAGAGMMIMMGVMYTPFFALFARTSYKKQKALTRKYRQLQKERRHVTIKHLGTALKNM